MIGQFSPRLTVRNNVSTEKNILRLSGSVLKRSGSLYAIRMPEQESGVKFVAFNVMMLIACFVTACIRVWCE